MVIFFLLYKFKNKEIVVYVPSKWCIILWKCFPKGEKSASVVKKGNGRNENELKVKINLKSKTEGER